MRRHRKAREELDRRALARLLRDIRKQEPEYHCWIAISADREPVRFGWLPIEIAGGP